MQRIQAHPLGNFLGKIWAKFGQNLDKIWEKVIWAKSKSCIPKNIGSRTVMNIILTML